MMMIVDVTKLCDEFANIADELEKLGQDIGVSIKLQHEDIFNKMHRI